jgi:hypothetical protein
MDRHAEHTTEWDLVWDEITRLRERVEWLESAMGLITAKIDRDFSRKRGPNLWELANLARQMHQELRDE